MSDHFLEQKIEFIKGVGPMRAAFLKSELGIVSVKDVIYEFPFRYVDKTQFNFIKDINTDGQQVLLKGTLLSAKLLKAKGRSRVVGSFKDSSGFIELVWFQGAQWIIKSLVINQEYTIFGKVNIYKGKKTIPHPEMEIQSSSTSPKLQLTFDPVYHSTEKLNAKGLDSKFRKRLSKTILAKLKPNDVTDTLPDHLKSKFNFCSKFEAIRWIHFPKTQEQINQAENRLKFEEIFFHQLRMIQSKIQREHKFKGLVFEKVGEKFNRFFSEKLPFELTGAQKRVLKEIRRNLGSGVQMNRLLQGDVGSGKTIVGLMCMLLAIDNGYQACLLAPTEILALQHYHSIIEQVKGLRIRIAFLSGSVTGKKRKQLFQLLKDGDLDILIGTHAVLEDPVEFKNLGLAITDEQHRFGVAQRSKLWIKNKTHPPHILVMTATPIPRTLAMTVYGDLDVSVIDELPPGRKSIQTVHRSEKHRSQVIDFMHKEIAKGRQIYIVFPLIEESETLDLKNLQEGYEQLLQFFPLPDYQISVVHGRMKPQDKENEMQRFVKGKTQIMVATTVIEVGVNVPNASIMIVENAERFGLSQLHQLRGRVGRGAEQSYCILMTSYKLSVDAKERIRTMCRTNNGFEIAEADMQLRGHGDLQGTAQSGISQFQLINIVTDQRIVETARFVAKEIIQEDPKLDLQKHALLKTELNRLQSIYKDWGRIS